MSGFLILTFMTLSSLFLLTRGQQQPNLSQVLLFHVLEKSAIGTFVGDVTKSSGLVEIYSAEERTRFQFSFRSAANLFTIESNTGIVRTAQVIDRDRMCPYQKNCFQNAEVQLRPTNYFTIFKLVIDILDINDHSPTFVPSNVSINLSDKTPPGTLFFLPSADDPDGGTDGVQSYRMTPLVPQFELLVVELIDGSTTLRLRLKPVVGQLQSMTLTVVADDGGKPARWGALLIEVIVVTGSAADNPTFGNTTYDVTVDENTAIGTILLSVKVVDTKPQIIYTMDDISKEQFGKIFDLNNRTGAISVIGQIDYEQHRVCQLTVIAVDSSRPSGLPAYTRVIIVVKNLNDNAPVITVSALVASGQLEVMDSSPAGTVVAFISVSDRDGSSLISCTIDTPVFLLDPADSFSDFRLATAVTFTRGVVTTYSLMLTCVDNGSPSLSSFQRIVVSVRISGPRFMANPIITEIVEGNSIGDVVLVLNASSADATASMTFKLNSIDEAPTALSVNSRTGVVTALIVFKYDVRQRYLYLATVGDRNSLTTSGTATVILNVVKNSANSTYVASLGSEQNSIVITGVVCATVITVVIVGVVVAGLYGYRRRHSSDADKDQDEDKANVPEFRRETSSGAEYFTESNNLDDASGLRRVPGNQQSVNYHRSDSSCQEIGLPSKYPREIYPTRSFISSDSKLWLDYNKHAARESNLISSSIRQHGYGNFRMSVNGDTDQESESGCSGSFADSGRGLSDGGESGLYSPRTDEHTKSADKFGVCRRSSRSRVRSSARRYKMNTEPQDGHVIENPTAIADNNIKNTATRLDSAVYSRASTSTSPASRKNSPRSVSSSPVQEYWTSQHSNRYNYSPMSQHQSRDYVPGKDSCQLQTKGENEANWPGEEFTADRNGLIFGGLQQASKLSSPNSSSMMSPRADISSLKSLQPLSPEGNIGYWQSEEQSGKESGQMWLPNKPTRELGPSVECYYRLSSMESSLLHDGRLAPADLRDDANIYRSASPTSHSNCPGALYDNSDHLYYPDPLQDSFRESNYRNFEHSLETKVNCKPNTLPISSERSDCLAFIPEETDSQQDQQIISTYQRSISPKATYIARRQNSPLRRYSQVAQSRLRTLYEDEISQITSPNPDVLFIGNDLNKTRRYHDEAKYGADGNINNHALSTSPGKDPSNHIIQSVGNCETYV